MSREEDAKAYARLTRRLLEDSSIESYLEYRARFPCGDFAADRFCTMEAPYAFSDELKAFDIKQEVIVAVLDGDDRAIDSLALQLLQHLLNRQKAIKSGVSHGQSRRKVIPDSLLDYLIVMMLGACDLSSLPPPSALVFLTRERLCGPNPALYVKQQVFTKRQEAVCLAALSLMKGQKVSVRGIAKALGVEASTVSRWFRGKSLMLEAQRFSQMFVRPEKLQRKIR